ncbi:MAG: hypothetical protein ACE145_09690 [Terriglobia bacterium]
MKWATLLHLARTQKIDTVLQVAFYRPEAEALSLQAGKSSVRFPDVILEHFPRKLEEIGRLARKSGLRVGVFNEPFMANGASREEYIKKVVARIKSLEHSRLLVLLDPDTGIALGPPKAEHASPRDIQTIFGVLRPGDWLVLYQHAHRKGGWQVATLQRFAETVGIRSDKIRQYSCRPLAKDVVLFAVKRTKLR